MLLRVQPVHCPYIILKIKNYYIIHIDNFSLWGFIRGHRYGQGVDSAVHTLSFVGKTRALYVLLRFSDAVRKLAEQERPTPRQCAGCVFAPQQFSTFLHDKTRARARVHREGNLVKYETLWRVGLVARHHHFVSGQKKARENAG